MSLEVGMERLSILRSMWMRKRHRIAVEVDQRRKTEYDCQMLYVYFEFIIPVLLDFLVVVKHAPPQIYMYMLSRFMQALGTLGCSNYYSDFLLYSCDLLRLHRELPLQFGCMMHNLNRFCSSVPIEKWHAVMTPLALHFRGVRDHKAIDCIASEMHKFYQADEFARTYGDVLKRCRRQGWSLPNPDLDARYFHEVNQLSKDFGSLLQTMRASPARKVSDKIHSPIFGEYPARLLGQNHDFQWPSSGK